MNRKHYFTDLFNDMDAMVERVSYPFHVRTFTLGSVYDPERYELKERDDYKALQAKKKQEEIEELERNRDSMLKYYENRLSLLKEEKQKLLTKSG